MRIPALYLTSVICGFCMMALEMMGGRFLQPQFGTGIDTWSAIITVFILSLSIGYVMGGRIADRTRSNKALGIVIVISGLFYLLLPIYAWPATSAIGEALKGSSVGVLVAALLLFFVPSLLLGCVSPMLVKLVFEDSERIGRTTGTLYAIGSFGNVAGILCSTYFLLGAFQLNSNMIGMGIILCLTGIAHLFISVDAEASTNAALKSDSKKPADQVEAA